LLSVLRQTKVAKHVKTATKGRPVPIPSFWAARKPQFAFLFLFVWWNV
jgi:hypothetical protein